MRPVEPPAVGGGSMMPSATSRGTIEARVETSMGEVHLLRQYWNESIDVCGSADVHLVQLALLRSEHARGCFPERWGPQRFERIGDVFMVPAHEALHAKSECRQQYSITCTFFPEAVRAWLHDDLQWTDSRLQASLAIPSPAIRNTLYRLGEELRSPGFASQAMIETLSGQVVIELARFYMGIDQRRALGGLSAWKLRLIDERLAAEGAPPSLAELATLCGLSVRHLTRAFRVSRGRSIGDYMADCRIERAKQRLASGECVKSIAYSMGFASPSNFSAAFRRATGETPREYRERVARRAIKH
jgi:AraC family transcriptional regulator